MHAGTPLDGVEDEEFWFRAEIGGIAETGGFEISLGTFCQATWAAVITFAVCRVDYIASQNQGRFVHEWIDIGGFRIRHQLHVGCLNAFPAGD
ncbi:hypothetical protein D9M68_923570 [compost metagenome]